MLFSLRLELIKTDWEVKTVEVPSVEVELHQLHQLLDNWPIKADIHQRLMRRLKSNLLLLCCACFILFVIVNYKNFNYNMYI